MTLILACLTPTHVYQVSDRRLTALNGANPGGLIDDERNKAVLFEGNLAFGYTGLADLPGDRTDLWLAKTLGSGPSADLSVAIERVRASATTVFAALPLPKGYLRHAFLGVGWMAPAGQRELLPTAVLVENALDDNGEFEAVPRSDFRTRVECYQTLKHGLALHSVGARVLPGQRDVILRFISRLVKHGRSPLAILESMLSAVRWVARKDATIGTSLMGLCTPKAAVVRSSQTGQVPVLAGAPIVDVPTFVYLGESSSQAEYYGPTTVAGGWMLSNFTVSRGA